MNNNSTSVKSRTAMPAATYWRSLDELADTPEFRQWVEREFPRGRQRVDRSGDPAAFREDHVRLVPAGGRGACGHRLPPAGRKDRAFRQEAGELRPRRAAVFMPPPCRPAAAPFRWWSSPTTAGRPRSKATRLHPDSNGGTDRYAQASILNLYDPDRAARFTQQRQNAPGEARH